MEKIAIWVPLEHFKALAREAARRKESHTVADVAAQLLQEGCEGLQREERNRS